MSCRTNHLPHSTMVTGEDTLLSWWNVASRGPRAYGYVLLVVLTFFFLDVILCAPISLFAFVAESAKARLRRHGPELHRWPHRLSLAPLPRLLFMAACWIALFYSSVYQGKLWYFSVVSFCSCSTRRGQSPVVTPCSRNPVTIRFGFIFAHFHQRCARRFRRLQSCTQTVARCRRTLGQREQTLSGTTANMVVRFRAFS